MPKFKQYNSIKPLAVVVVLICLFACQRDAQVDYSSQIKPILNKRCIGCHGGVAKQGGFSLLFEESAVIVCFGSYKAVCRISTRYIARLFESFNI